MWIPSSNTLSTCKEWISPSNSQAKFQLSSNTIAGISLPLYVTYSTAAMHCPQCRLSLYLVNGFYTPIRQIMLWCFMSVHPSVYFSLWLKTHISEWYVKKFEFWQTWPRFSRPLGHEVQITFVYDLSSLQLPIETWYIAPPWTSRFILILGLWPSFPRSQKSNLVFEW